MWPGLLHHQHFLPAWNFALTPSACAIVIRFFPFTLGLNFPGVAPLVCCCLLNAGTTAPPRSLLQFFPLPMDRPVGSRFRIPPGRSLKFGLFDFPVPFPFLKKFCRTALMSIGSHSTSMRSNSSSGAPQPST